MDMNPTDRLLAIAAPSLLPVLLLGESGCGKEVAARTLHKNSPRHSKPFIAVNCGAFPPGLLESQLCGHVRGAFTGADREQVGFVRAAAGGTLFLDEIGELPLDAQSRLLRILQEKCVTPVGAQREIPVDFRLICATHHHLESDVRLGRFRQDLYFRIAAFPVRLPPLRERLGELPTIAARLWKEASPPHTPDLDREDLYLLSQRKWPGNIRQLRNVLERYALLREHSVSLDEILDTESWDSAANLGLNTPSKLPLKAPRIRAPAPDRIAACLLESNFNKSRTARRLGISRGSLCYQLRKAASPPGALHQPNT